MQAKRAGSEERAGSKRSCARWAATRSLSRARTFNGDTLKVNDKRGNPIEIAAVVVWRVEPIRRRRCSTSITTRTTRRTQSESAVRHLASRYAYDRRRRRARSTLRGNVDDVSRALRDELQERLAKAGHRGRRGAIDAPRLRAGDRAGDAAPPAGRGRHRRAAEDRARRGQHGRHGADANWRRSSVVQAGRRADAPRWSAT